MTIGSKRQSRQHLKEIAGNCPQRRVGPRRLRPWEMSAVTRRSRRNLPKVMPDPLPSLHGTRSGEIVVSPVGMEMSRRDGTSDQSPRSHVLRRIRGHPIALHRARMRRRAKGGRRTTEIAVGHESDSDGVRSGGPGLHRNHRPSRHWPRQPRQKVGGAHHPRRLRQPLSTDIVATGRTRRRLSSRRPTTVAT